MEKLAGMIEILMDEEPENRLSVYNIIGIKEI